MGPSSYGTEVLIRGGTVVTPEAMFVADVLIGDGIIRALGTDLSASPGSEVIEA